MQLTNIHEILEPLPINFQSQAPAILPSRKASPKYVKANQRWWLEVQFSSDIDLALFEKTIAGSPIRVIEFQHRFFIEDPRIPDVDDMRVGLGLVSRYAEDELPRLNAGVKVLCPQYVPARLRCIVYLDDKGQGHPITFAEGVVHGSDEVEAIHDFLRGPNTVFPRSSTCIRDKLIFEKHYSILGLKATRGRTFTRPGKSSRMRWVVTAQFSRAAGVLETRLLALIAQRIIRRQLAGSRDTPGPKPCPRRIHSKNVKHEN